MAVTSGDMAQAFALRRRDAALKSEVTQLSQEVVTGQAADSGARLRGDFSRLAAVDASRARLEALEPALASAATTVSAMQTAFSGITAALTTATEAASQGVNMSADTAATAAASAFASVVAALQTQVAGQSVFAGTRPDGAALADAETILAALDDAVAGATTASEVQARVADWFASPDGFDAVAYKGGGARADVMVGAGEAVALSVTAADPALKQALEGLALGAMVARGAVPDSQAGTLLAAVSEKLIAASDAVVDLSARTGFAEARIDAARSRNASQLSALDIARTEMLAVDSYESATRLEAVQTQIETLYAVTSRLSKMSLVDFL